MDLYALLDYDTHPCSRANGTFYVIEIKDDTGNVIPNLVAINKLYNNLNEVNQDVNMAFGMPTTIIHVYEDN